MNNTVTIVVIAAVLVIAYFLLPDGDMNNNAIRDQPGSKQVAKEIAEDSHTIPGEDQEPGSMDYAKSSAIQKQRDTNSKTYNSQQLEPEIRNAINELVNTSHEGLVEETTEHGVGVDLKDRFRTAPVATINEKGEILVQDYTSAPEQ